MRPTCPRSRRSAWTSAAVASAAIDIRPDQEPGAGDRRERRRDLKLSDSTVRPPARWRPPSRGRRRIRPGCAPSDSRAPRRRARRRPAVRSAHARASIPWRPPTQPDASSALRNAWLTKGLTAGSPPGRRRPRPRPERPPAREPRASRRTELGPASLRIVPPAAVLSSRGNAAWPRRGAGVHRSKGGARISGFHWTSPRRRCDEAETSAP